MRSLGYLHDMGLLGRLAGHQLKGNIMPKVDPTEMAAVKDGIVLSGAMPYIEDEIKNKLKAIDNQALSAVNAGDLTPERALNLWTERNVLLKLLGSLGQRVRNSQSKAKKYQKELDF